jgi:alanine racemase
VRAGTPVGYGHTWLAPAATWLGLVPLGYADGLPRTASGQAEVQVRGVRRPLVGLLSMDMAVVDLGDCSAEVGETVTVFGPGDRGEPTVAEWAAWAGTIEHEIVTGLGPRLRRLPVPALRSVR